MQAMGLFSRRSLLGRSNKSTVHLEKIAKENSLNKTGSINYNKYGEKDDIGFTPCSEKFVDNFLFYVLVPDYFVTAQKHYTEVGVVNKHIRDMLTRCGLQKCKVKAISLSSLKKQPLEEELDKVYGRIKAKETGETKYHVQEFKIACADEQYSDVLAFLRSDEYKLRNIYLKDIDVTMDYSGSFDKEEVIRHLTTNKGFRMQGDQVDANRTILDNNDDVGNNCLTYMESVDGMTTRCKIYNKMVQMLESKSVRETVGQHWKDWVCQKDTRLAKARDLAKHRGLTRAEVTFYCKDCVPDDEFMEDTLTRITKYVPATLVYSTPFARTWQAYCNTMLHSLVVVDRTRDFGLLVYSYNENTKNISGQFVEKWSEKENWCLSNSTLGAKLPVDVIEVCDRIKSSSGVKKEKTKDTFLGISGARYFKYHGDGSLEFTTRLVSKGGVYSWNDESKEVNLHLLENAGFVPHEYCTPYLAHVQGNKNCKVDMKLCKADILEVKLPERISKRRRACDEIRKEQWKNITAEAAIQIQECRKPFEVAIAEKQKAMQLLDNYSSVFSDNAVIPLKDLPLGSYNVMAMRETQTQFGQKYVMLVDRDGEGNLGLCYSNKYIEAYLQENLSDAENEQIRDPKRNYLTLYNKPLAVLYITGWGRTLQRHVIVYCTMSFTSEMEKYSIKHKQRQLTREMKEDEKMLENAITESNQSKMMCGLAKEEMVPYKHMKNLAELPLGSTYTILAIGYSEHYGQQKLVLKLDDGTLYQAGDNLEEQKEQLMDGCKIVITKTKLSSTRKKYAICKIVQRGDWAGILEYEKVPLLPPNNKRKNVKVLDVKPIVFKGKKRKLLLVEDAYGAVYKVKRSKLEDTVQPGQFV